MSRRSRNNDFFWISYSDLMTTLFFVMLILFALTVIYLKVEQKKVETEKQNLERILQLNEQFKSLNDDDDFEYLKECKKFIVKEFKGIEIFEPNKANILPKYKHRTIEAGKNIEKYLNKLETENKGFSFLLVIEGNMANRYDHSISKDAEYGYKISYEGHWQFIIYGIRMELILEKTILK